MNNTKLTKRALCTILALVMLFSLAPFSAFADGDVTEYDIWIAGVRVTSETIAKPPSDWEETTYDPETNTLTLHGSFESGTYNDAVVYTTMENLNVKGYIKSDKIFTKFSILFKI